jgi:EAL domain-containing protein (putative c-di-GMP-specific phosphodiesterase class I)
MLEITESLVAEPLYALSTLAELRAAGVGLAIDDFGVGSLSLLALKQLPVDEIKIDKSFVLGMHTQEMDAAVVRSIIDIAHHLGCKVVAEGVESESASNELAALGCDLAQATSSALTFGRRRRRWLAEKQATARV